MAVFVAVEGNFFRLRNSVNSFLEMGTSFFMGKLKIEYEYEETIDSQERLLEILEFLLDGCEDEKDEV